MLISNTIRANLTDELCLKKKLHSFFHGLIDIIYNFRSENSLDAILECSIQKLYSAKIV